MNKLAVAFAAVLGAAAVLISTASASGGYGHPGPAPYHGHGGHHYVDNVHYSYHHAPYDYHGAAHVSVNKVPGSFKYEVKEEGKSRVGHGYGHGGHGGHGYGHGHAPAYHHGGPAY